MDTLTESTVLGQASAALDTLATRIGDLLRSLPTTQVPIPGSEWTVRDAAAHLASGTTLYSEIANGASSPIEAAFGDGPAYRDAAAAVIQQMLGDVPEADPSRLAALVLEGARRLIETTAGRSDDQLVPYHCGVPLSLAHLMSIMVGEYLLHGYDIAIAAGSPWPIDPSHAALVLAAYAPNFGYCLNPATTRAVEVACEIELRGVGRLVARVADGDYRLEPADSGPVDCVISADPVAYLLVAAGRISQWTAIALGLLSVGGRRPELALRFGEFFVYP